MADGIDPNTSTQPSQSPPPSNGGDQQDVAQAILTPLQGVDNNIKGQAWEIYHNSDGPEFEKKLAALPMPEEAKAALWNAKVKGVKPPPPAQNQQNQNQPQGFLSTVGDDIGKFASSIAGLPGQLYDYATATPDRKAELQRQADEETHKSAVYKESANAFHQGHYFRAITNLVNLFDPKYDDPADPLAQMMKSQWDSSAQAKQSMIQAAKDGDYLAVAQHAAGILPVASQVDAAMEAYRKDPSRENLAHVVTSAIPAFVPALARAGAKIATPMISGAKSLASSGVQGATDLLGKLKTEDVPTPAGQPAQAAGSAVQSELRAGEAPIQTPAGKTPQEAGETVQQSMAATRDTQGAAVGAAKDIARPQDFTLQTGQWHTGLGQKLSEIDNAIGGDTSGLESLKEPELANVRKVVEELQTPRTLDNNEIDAIRNQLKSKIDQQQKAFNSGGVTGDALRYYKQIKAGFDEEILSNVSDPQAAQILKAANKTYAETVARQTKGPSKAAVKAQSPEQIITRYAKGGPAQQSEVESIMQDLDPAAKQTFQDSILKRIVDSSTKDGVTNWEAVQKNLQGKGEMGKSLFGNRYNQILQDVAHNAKLGPLKGLAPEQVITRFAKGGAESQSEVEALMQELSPQGQRVLQDSVLKQIVETSDTGWSGIQKNLKTKGDMGKALLGNRYDDIVKAVDHNAKLEKLKGAAGKVAISTALGALGIATWYGVGKELVKVLGGGP